jgi:hypothetical protein
VAIKPNNSNSPLDSDPAPKESGFLIETKLAKTSKEIAALIEYLSLLLYNLSV